MRMTEADAANVGELKRLQNCEQLAQRSNGSSRSANQIRDGSMNSHRNGQVVRGVLESWLGASVFKSCTIAEQPIKNLIRRRDLSASRSVENVTVQEDRIPKQQVMWDQAKMRELCLQLGQFVDKTAQAIMIAEQVGNRKIRGRDNVAQFANGCFDRFSDAAQAAPPKIKNVASQDECIRVLPVD